MAKNSESKPGAPGAPAADTAGGKGKPKKSPSAAAGAAAATAKGGGAASGKKGAAVAAGAGQAQAGAAPATPQTPSGPPEPPEGIKRQQKPSYVPRLRRRYLDEVVPKLKQEFGIKNTMAVPRLERISLNMGMGEAIQNIKILDDAVEEMAALAGQRPTVTRAQKSIAAFKLRAGMPIGCRVTLRGARMWDFLDRFISVALPRVRDFRGVSPKSFDGRGNYTMGIRDHLIFLEIDYNKVERPKGMNVTIVTTAGNDERALYLLRELGMPFARPDAGR
ncbi:MAG TPA: 50S ribosomal protein L5 [Thermoanaerobaculia bacterium]|nr:50S ribosomal protein L5 [Thermoanaerobaculia bacterium]